MLDGRCKVFDVMELCASCKNKMSTSSITHPTSHVARSGISLIEILISMFVLLFGLMGVAAIFPVGSHYMTQGETFEATSLASQNAYEEMQTRGILNPENWNYPVVPAGTSANNDAFSFILNSSENNAGSFNVDAVNTNYHPGHAYIIDPISIGFLFETNGNTNALDQWPASFNDSGLPVASDNPWLGFLPGNNWPCKRMNIDQIGLSAAEAVFRLRDDLSVILPEDANQPGQQVWSDDGIGNPLARQFKGDFSWIASVVPQTEESLLNLQPSYNSFGSHLYEVSVITFRKRDFVPSETSERLLNADMLLGGELVMYGGSADAVDTAVDGIRPNNWVAVMGVHPTTGRFLLTWYRLLSIDEQTSVEYLDTQGAELPLRRAMLRGPDWPIPTSEGVATDLRVVLMPNIVHVVTRQMRLDATGWDFGAYASSSVDE